MTDKEEAKEAETQEALQAEVAESAAGLSASGAEQVTVTLAEQTEAGTLTHEDIVDAVHDAEVVEDAREHAHEMQLEQADLAEHGDYTEAREAAIKAEGDLETARDHGGENAHPDLEVQVTRQGQETQALGNAGWEQAIAVDEGQSAAAYAASGDANNAEAYAERADDHTETAEDYGDQGDHGGTQATSTDAEMAGETSE